MQTDGHDEANNRFSHFWERAYKWKERVLNPQAKYKVVAYVT
jgi:hypothetical protein